MFYAENFKKTMVQKLLLPGGPSVLTLSRESGVSEQSLYNWKSKYQNGVTGEPEYHRSPRQWRDEDKYDALLEAARLTGEDLGKWLREKGLRSEHIEIWRHEMKKNLNQQKKNTELKEARNRIKKLERELHRKDKALAEMSALVVLKKKVELLWGDEEV
jgi:transposase-like protein